jgi:hypothetical protein
MSIEVVKNYKLPKGCDLGLKVYYADGRPHSNKASSDFRWPVTLAKGKAVVVSAPDWRADSECGGGLHVWRWGEGGFDASPLSDRDDATVLWAAVEYVSAGAVDLSGKVKVSSGKVVAIGSRREIATWIATMAPNGVRVAWGTATAGDAGTATAGTRGTATAGYAGTATAGYDGVISILWWDGQAQKYRRQVGVIDGVTLKPWTRYTLDSVGQWVEGATLTEAERPEAVLAAAYAKAKAKK